MQLTGLHKISPDLNNEDIITANTEEDYRSDVINGYNGISPMDINHIFLDHFVIIYLIEKVYDLIQGK